MLEAARLKAVAEASAVREGIRETVRLEAARVGDKAAPVPKEGPVRLRTRDGLASLFESGSLNKDQHAAGMAYRYCMEMAGAGLKSQLDFRVRASAGQVEIGARSKAELHRAYVMARLSGMEAAVTAAAIDGREMETLRLIAGEGWTLTALASGGNAKVARLTCLVTALDAVASSFTKGLAKGDG